MNDMSKGRGRPKGEDTRNYRLAMMLNEREKDIIFGWTSNKSGPPAVVIREFLVFYCLMCEKQEQEKNSGLSARK